MLKQCIIILVVVIHNILHGALDTKTLNHILFKRPPDTSKQNASTFTIMISTCIFYILTDDA